MPSLEHEINKSLATVYLELAATAADPNEAAVYTKQAGDYLDKWLDREILRVERDDYPTDD